MLTASEPQEFVPFGQEHCAIHPGEIQLQTHHLSKVEAGCHLVDALKDVSIKDTPKRKFWKIRSNPQDPEYIEELYVSGSTVVWSSGILSAGRKIKKSFTVDSPIQDVEWCSFQETTNKPGILTKTKLDDDSLVKVLPSICIVEADTVNIFTQKGDHFMAALPFQVMHTWSMKYGLLFERSVTQSELTSTTGENESLPILFSMLHPLDEIAPVVCKVSAHNYSNICFVNDHQLQIVFSCEELSLILTYDIIQRLHAIWNVRRAKTEEGLLASRIHESSPCLQTHSTTSPLTGTSSYQISQSKLTLSNQSPSLSPFRSFPSHVASPSAHSRSHSPAITHMAALSRSQSPSASVSQQFRYSMTSSPASRSPNYLNKSPITLGSPYSESCSEMMEPLAPDICLEHLWTEPSTGVKDGFLGKASKAFVTTDFIGQRFICCLIPHLSQIRCVKIEWSNDKSQLIFGIVTSLPARDAENLESLCAMVVLDLNYSLTLFSGINKVGRIHLPCLPLSLSASLRSFPQTSNRSWHASGILTSSRPSSALDACFDEGVSILSPVPLDMMDEESRTEENYLTEEFSFPVNVPITAVSDGAHNSVTFETANGSLYRTSLPKMATSPLVQSCLQALQSCLSRDIAMQVLIKWYITQNAPGGVYTSHQHEWNQFVTCLLAMMGYDTEKMSLIQKMSVSQPSSPIIAPKKPKPSDQGCNEDWLFLLDSDTHKNFSKHFCTLGLPHIHSSMEGTEDVTVGKINPSSLLFQHIPSILYALHLLYEELKLNVLFWDHLQSLATLLYQLASDLQATYFLAYYGLDFPSLLQKCEEKSQIDSDLIAKMCHPPYLTQEPPSIFEWLYKSIKNKSLNPFPCLPAISKNTMKMIILYTVMMHNDQADCHPGNNIKWIVFPEQKLTSSLTSLKTILTSELAQTTWERMVLCITKLGIKQQDLEYFPFGVTIPLRDAIFQCQQKPRQIWPKEAYILIGRQDLCTQPPPANILYRNASADHVLSKSVFKEEDDGMEGMDHEILKLRFSEDQRVQEVRRLLQSSRPVKIAIIQRPEVSDHEFIEEQERHLYAFCIRTMSLSVGRGMFTLRTSTPVITETLPIPKLCLTGRAPPRNTTVDLSRIDVPANMNAWPSFHNGVAAGLRIAPNASKIDSTWIAYNKPKGNELTNEHAGFLMALGLNGHLMNLATMNIHDYLCKAHEMTSVGLLLGMAAAKRRTMDMATTKLLSIHVDALLPPTSTELDVPNIMQVSAILGMGLVYEGTAHRHTAEVLLAEIGRPPGPEMENSTDRESYSLAAGLALGLVMFGRGSETVGLSDLSMADQLFHYMVGGHKRPLIGRNKEKYKSPSYQIKEGNSVNIDVTSPGATLALGMMFFKTMNRAVADWMTAPDTQFLLDFVRPDFLLLRTLSKGLMLWHEIHPSEGWVERNVPEIVKKYAFNRSQYRDQPDCNIDFETMSQVYCNIVAGACMVMGLRFAGSCNAAAFSCLLQYSTRFIKLSSKTAAVEQAGKSTIEICINVVVLSLAMVMAGSGNLDVLRICRHLHARVGQASGYILYGSHMATHMALGLLFLGGGRYTLSTSNSAVAALLCAFFPKFPTHSNDNRYHLQAFRHLYVLAVEPLLLIPRDIITNKACYAHLLVQFKDSKWYKNQSFCPRAPCVLPELDLLQEVSVVDPRYWPITFHRDKNWNVLKNILANGGNFFIKQRIGCLSYIDDPKGFRSLFPQSTNNDRSWTIQVVLYPDAVKAFSSDPKILAIADLFCKQFNQDESWEQEMRQLLTSLLYECVTQEKTEMFTTYVEMDQVVRRLSKGHNSCAIWQIKLAISYCQRFLPRAPRESDLQPLMNEEYIFSVKNQIEKFLDGWAEGSTDTLSEYLQNRSTATVDPLLFSYILWHDIPCSLQLKDLNLTDIKCFPELILRLQPLHIPIHSIMKIFTFLKANICNSSLTNCEK